MIANIESNEWKDRSSKQLFCVGRSMYMNYVL